MTLLILGLLLFFAVHTLPSFSSVYQPLRDRLGMLAFQGIFSLIAVTGLVLALIGKRDAPIMPVWEPNEFTMSLAPGLMLPAAMLLVLAYVPSNVKRYLRHPMLTAVLLWSVAHLLANGHLAAMVFFGSFAVYSVFAMISANRRGATKSKETKSMLWDLAGAGGGIALYALGVFLHPYLFGVPAILPKG
ncbi:NnrU family protein [Thioalkalicoccus limnaeus]|uniref:NnrU family protein n=1 Tax=Thioalkalicoccus limnaeus TaxID=120681 RepID=A0ABV4BGH0_9GAMM